MQTSNLSFDIEEQRLYFLYWLISCLVKYKEKRMSLTIEDDLGGALHHRLPPPQQVVPHPDRGRPLPRSAVIGHPGRWPLRRCHWRTRVVADTACRSARPRVDTALARRTMARVADADPRISDGGTREVHHDRGRSRREGTGRAADLPLQRARSGLRRWAQCSA